MIKETGCCAEVVGEIDVLVAREVYELILKGILYILDLYNILAENTGDENFKALKHLELPTISECRSQGLALESWNGVRGAA